MISVSKRLANIKKTDQKALSKHGVSSLKIGAEGQTRTADTCIFSAVLYQLSYLGTEGILSAAAVECPTTPCR